MPVEPTVQHESRVSPVAVAQALTELPSAPGVVARLSRWVHEGNASLLDMGRLVRLDPGLALQVLRAAYATRESRLLQCFTIEDSVNAVGADWLHRRVAEISHAQILDRPLSVYGLDMDDFWRSSVACACAAELVAERCGEDADLAYAIGLIHGVGLLAVEAWARQDSPSLVFARRSWPREYSAGEGALLGFTNADVAGTLLQWWGFPAAVVQAVRNQYVPPRYGAHARLSCLLYAAKWIRDAVCVEDAAPPLPDDRYLDVLHLTSYELVRWVVDIRVSVGQARNAVGTKAA